MDTNTEALCGHTYTTLGARVFRCTLKPHPARPDNHYFERDHDAVPPTPRRRMAIVPGDRRG